MTQTAKRITANIPSDLLKEAQEATGLGITETLVKGLYLVKKSRAYEKGMNLKGKFNLKLNLDQLRERSYR